MTEDISSISTGTKIFYINKYFICQQETYSGFTNTDKMKEKVLEVLRQIHRETGEEEVRVDMWCHFGHACITKVDEGGNLTS